MRTERTKIAIAMSWWQSIMLACVYDSIQWWRKFTHDQGFTW